MIRPENAAHRARVRHARPRGQQEKGRGGPSGGRRGSGVGKRPLDNKTGVL